MTPKERAAKMAKDMVYAYEVGATMKDLDGVVHMWTKIGEKAVTAAIEDDREAWIMGQNEYLLYFLKWLQLNKYKGEDAACFVESFLNHFHNEHDVEQKEGPSV